VYRDTLPMPEVVRAFLLIVQGYFDNGEVLFQVCLTFYVCKFNKGNLKLPLVEEQDSSLNKKYT
jgi:hypothetical protein